MENKSSSLSHAYMFVYVSTLKRVQTQHTSQKQSVYNPNEPESQYLVWPPLQHSLNSLR